MRIRWVVLTSKEPRRRARRAAHALRAGRVESLTPPLARELVRSGRWEADQMTGLLRLGSVVYARKADALLIPILDDAEVEGDLPELHVSAPVAPRGVGW